MAAANRQPAARPKLRYAKPLDQRPDAAQAAEFMDQFEARLDRLRRQAGIWHQRAVFGIDIGPGDAEHAGPPRGINRAAEAAPVAGADRHARTLSVAAGIFGWRWA